MNNLELIREICNGLDYINFDVLEYDGKIGTGIAIQLPKGFMRGSKKGRTRVQEFISACMTEVRLTSNGYQGGDAGHGGFVKIKVKDLGSTCMLINGNEVSDFTFEVKGDCERDNLIAAMEWIINELKQD